MFNATEKSSKIRTGLANYLILRYSFQLRKILLVKEREGGRKQGREEGKNEGKREGRGGRKRERKGDDFLRQKKNRGMIDSWHSLSMD